MKQKKQKNKEHSMLFPNLPFYRIYSRTERQQSDAPLLPTNFITRSMHPFSNGDLRHREKWLWNQCNSKITIPIDDSTSSCFQKMYFTNSRDVTILKKSRMRKRFLKLSGTKNAKNQFGKSSNFERQFFCTETV